MTAEKDTTMVERDAVRANMYEVIVDRDTFSSTLMHVVEDSRQFLVEMDGDMRTITLLRRRRIVDAAH